MSAVYDETKAEIAAVKDPVDELRELIEESDRLLDELETLNRDGETLTTAASDWTADLSDRVLGILLPEEHKARLETQAALNYVYDEVQEVLFLRRRRAIGFDDIVVTDETDEEPEP